MRTDRQFFAVDSHTAGEPTRVVVGGFPMLRGSTLREKDAALRDECWPLVRLLTGEPRGHAPMHAVLPLPPCDAKADVSLLIVAALGSLTMCGHALIGAVTTLLELGMLPRRQPTTTLTVETLAGLLSVEAEVSDGKVTQVTFSNAPSWVLATDVVVDVAEVGTVRLDLVYGGLWYAVADVEQFGVDIEPGSLPRLVRLSYLVRRAVNARLSEFDLPRELAPTSVPQLLFIGPAKSPGADGRNLATSTELGFDRSPCGTGSSARMALLHARGQLGIGESFVHESVLGTRFVGSLFGETTTGGVRAVLPRITGTAYVTAISQLVSDPDDPLALGFHLPQAGE